VESALCESWIVAVLAGIVWFKALEVVAVLHSFSSVRKIVLWL